jgi:hypothetical protein
MKVKKLHFQIFHCKLFILCEKFILSLYENCVLFYLVHRGFLTVCDSCYFTYDISQYTFILLQYKNIRTYTLERNAILQLL